MQTLGAYATLLRRLLSASISRSFKNVSVLEVGKDAYRNLSFEKRLLNSFMKWFQFHDRVPV